MYFTHRLQATNMQEMEEADALGMQTLNEGLKLRIFDLLC
jgi:hypothetical protein